jgi:hypothetical protein
MVIWRDRPEPDRFRIEVGGQSGTVASFNDIASMFIGKEI